jgi:uncharacterized protein (DUF427 family)
MVRALWNGAVIAEAPAASVKMVEGNVYFPPDALDRQYFVPTVQTTRCIWKGRASYYDIVVSGKTNPGAAWYYPSPTILAKRIASYVAFWQGVEINQS